jgi:MFS family permease
MHTSTDIPPAPASTGKRSFIINRNFGLLWSGQTISEFGSRITREGLPLAANLVLQATPVQMGLLAAIGTLPVLLVSLFAGVWVDRLRRRPLLIVADLGRAVLLLSIPLAAMLGLLRIEQLYLVAALVGILTVIFEVANQSFLPGLVAREQIVEANSKLSASSSLAEIGGPTLAGVLVQAITAPLAILFDALSFLVSALCAGFIRVPEARPSPAQERQNLWREIQAGLRLLLGNPVLRAITLSTSTDNFFGGAFAALYGLFLIRELAVTPALYGVLVTFGGIGAFVGAFAAGRLVRRVGLGKTLIGAMLLSGAASLLTPLAGGPHLVIIAMLMASQLVGDFGREIYLINAVSLRQSIIPNHLLGRVNASAQFLTEGIWPLGAILAGLLSEAIGMRYTLLLGAGLGFLLSSAWLLFSPLRRLHQPSPLEIWQLR